MITEDYVSFEVAKLLKEKGFNETSNTIGTYDLNGSFYLYKHEKGYDHNRLSAWYSAPTLQMAMKWLREVHKLYMYAAHDSMENTWFARVYNDYKTLSDVDNYSTYEEACEAAITYCLKNLI